MTLLTASELAARLGVTKGRVSQYVSGGQLAGCYSGDGRNRRFDVAKCAAALGKRLDAGQMMGNGSATKRSIVDLMTQADEDAPAKPPQRQRTDGPVALTDPDRYELARIDKAEQEARRLRRQNAQEEGLYVLASEVERQVARIVGQEVAEFETVLREAARAVADALGVEFKAVRKVLMDKWRDHRAQRTEVLNDQAGQAVMTEAERDGDI